MKVYVAGKWSESKKIKNIMDMLESRGHVITLDWTSHIHPDKSREYAIEDIQAVRDCDVVIAYMPDQHIFYKGAWIEVGAALALNKQVVFIGINISGVFLGHPNCRMFSGIINALDYIDLLEYNKQYNNNSTDTDNYVMGL